MLLIKVKNQLQDTEKSVKQKLFVRGDHTGFCFHANFSKFIHPIGYSHQHLHLQCDANRWGQILRRYRLGQLQQDI